MAHLTLDNIDIEVIQKKIKNLHLRVSPPFGHVRVSAPETMSLDIIHRFIIEKINWIKTQQVKYQIQDNEVPTQYAEGESHYFNGKCYLLKLVERDAAPKVILTETDIELQVRPGWDVIHRKALLETWYLRQLKEKVSMLIPLWEKKMNVSVSTFSIRKMTTRWGSCSPASRSIRINFELVKKPFEYLEYIVVHELAHLIEPSHNKAFVAIMDNFLPNWRQCRTGLNGRG